MAEVYIRSFSPHNLDYLIVTLEDLIVLQVLSISRGKNIKLKVVHEEIDKSSHPLFKTSSLGLLYDCIESTSVCLITTYCKWPVVVVNNTIVAGLAAVARQIIKCNNNKEILNLLGFREACLMACNESSIWTKFCEIDIMDCIKNIIEKPHNHIKTNIFYVPMDLSRFECHMLQPVKIHNIYKLAREQNKNKLIKSNVPIDQLNLNHKYAEGPYMTLSDILLFCNFQVLFKVLDQNILQKHLPLSMVWYTNMSNVLKENHIDFDLISNFKSFKFETAVIHEPIAKESLYTSDPKRYKPQNRIYTKQANVEKALELVLSMLPLEKPTLEPFGHEINFSWSDVPLEANPLGGSLPEKRANRKCQQLENLAKAVITISQNNSYIIVDFCSGSGHLGLLIASLLPNCHVILVENKERSLKRASDRVDKMKLKNVTLVQSNLDYFVAKFDVGLALHACGVATDLVIKSCVENKAHFVCCPCCYGGIHDCHHLSYPRSEKFKKNNVGYKDYLIIGHAADQTHDKDNSKTDQGYLCMNIIDLDRQFYAEEYGYKVSLSKLEPTSCTPKNNLLVGLIQ